jgi:3-hydroxyacyl-[acyl-carrier-protein] dehydratase
MSIAEIESAIPHRGPMLLIDEIVERTDHEIVCLKTFHGDEFFLQGHYPEHPLVPGVILCECAMQAGGVLLSRLAKDIPGVPVATRLSDVKFRRMVRPGDTIRIEVRTDEQFTNTFFLKARVLCHGKLAVRLDFACTFTQPEPVNA